MRGYTVEMAFLMPVILLLIMSSIYAFFYYHDKNIISGAAYETAVVGSNKAREQESNLSGSGRTGADASELEMFFENRVAGKCILLSDVRGVVQISEDEICVQAQASWKKMKLSVEKRAAITKPEKKLRDIKKIKEFVSGAKDYN